MPIEFACSCRRTIRVADAHAGKKVKCPGCGAIQPVPIPVMVQEVVDDVPEAVLLEGQDAVPPPKKKKKKRTTRERELKQALREYDGDEPVGGRERGGGGFTITPAVISGVLLLVAGIAAMIYIKLAPEMGKVPRPRMFFTALAGTIVGAILLIKALVFGEED